MHTGDLVYTALLSLINVSEQQQRVVWNDYSVFRRGQWAREMCTIKLATARRGGHSTAVKNLVADVLPNAVTIYPNTTLKKIHGNGMSFCNYQITNGELEQKLRGIRVDAVIVDYTAYLDDQAIDKLYDIFTPYVDWNKRDNQPFFFIFVQ
jgi:hypothetical protein